MSALVSGYGSSDDESTPVASASTSRLPKLGNGYTAPPGVNDEEDEEDEDKLEEQARADAFGLTNKAAEEEERRTESKAVVKAAPDVLKEVSYCYCKRVVRSDAEHQDPNGAGMAIIARPSDKVMNVNLTYEEMSRPVAGPEDPFNQRKNKGMNSLAGHVEEQAMDAYTFAMQQRTFEVHGYAVNPAEHNIAAQPFVGSLNAAHENGYLSVENMKPSKATKREMKRKRGTKGDLTVVDGEDAYVGPWAKWEQDQQEEVVEEDEDESDEWRQEKKRREEAKEAAQKKMEEARQEKSIFHGKSSGCCTSSWSDYLGKELHDYAGRTYMHIPTDTDVKLNPADGATPPNAYVPERCVHTWVSDCSCLLRRRLMVAWSQQRCLCCTTLPQEWSPAIVCKYGHQNQGESP